MSIASLQSQLSTPQGFAAVVKAKRGLLSGAIGSFVAAAFCLGMNIFQLGSASDWDGRLMARFFLVADAIEFTGRRSGSNEMMRYLYVWAPFVLIPLGVLLLIAYLMTRKNSGVKMFEKYQQRGWLGYQLPLGITATSGRQQVPLSLMGRVDAPDGSLGTTATEFTAWFANADKKTQKSVSAAAVKAGALKGVPANLVHPNLPAEFIVAPRVGDGNGPVVVIAPEMGAAKPVHAVMGVKPPQA